MLTTESKLFKHSPIPACRYAISLLLSAVLKFSLKCNLALGYGGITCMEPSAIEKRRKRGLLLLVVALVLVVSAIVLVIVSPAGQKSSPVELIATPQYLQYQNSSSGIYLVSATANSGAFPLSDVIPPYPNYAVPTPTPVIRKGESCIIINATLRSDYTKENPSPNQWPNDNGTNNQTPNEYAYVFLTAKLYDKSGQEINATDVLLSDRYGASGGVFLCLHNGETDNATIYLVTSRTDIDHFTVEARYIGAIPLP